MASASKWWHSREHLHTHTLSSIMRNFLTLFLSRHCSLSFLSCAISNLIC